MPQNFIPCDRDQQMLMPTDMRDWLPADHLAWFVIDSVAELDLSSFYAAYRDDGWGRAAYDPAMMVALVLYAYAIGFRSAREMERRCNDDIAFRVITSNQRVDHATICRFLVRHGDRLAELFVSVLRLCAHAGMVRPGVVAIDGTKIAANASAARNLTREQLEEYARQVFDEAERINREEDELYGDKRGDEIPEHLIDRHARIEWLRQKLAEQQQTADKSNGTSKRKARTNSTDPDSVVQKTPQGYEQGYNGQLAVTQDQIIVAADLVSDNNDFGQLEPMITQAQDNLGVTDQAIGTVIADAGYFSDGNANLELGIELLVAPVATRNLDDAIKTRTEPIENDLGAGETERKIAARQAARRADVMAAYAARQVTGAEAAQALGTSRAHVKWLLWHHKKFGHLRWATVPSKPVPPNATQVMLKRFDQPGAMQTYALRARTIEPVIGQLKEARGMRRLLHRGRHACRCEWRLVATAHNLRKLWTRQRESLTASTKEFCRSLLLGPYWI
jgi:transposase